MQRIGFVLLLASTFGMISCSDIFVEESSESPVEQFNLIWREIDRHYSHFGLSDLNWDSIYASYRPLVSETTSDRDLYRLACRMIEELKDGHVNIFSPFGTCGYYGWVNDYPRNFTFDHVKQVYLEHGYQVTPDNRITYGVLTGNIGYIHIDSFSGRDWVADLDQVLEELQSVDALVLDVRDNGGGSGRSAEEIAGRFADEKRLYAYYQYRNGPRHDDFTEPTAMYVQPEGAVNYSGSVVILTNRGCFSACESFILAMKTLPEVTVIGDNTGGGLGNPIYRELPNGWSYRFPVWLQTLRDGSTIERIGISPDIRVEISAEDSRDRIDTILQEGVNMLAGQ